MNLSDLWFYMDWQVEKLGAFCPTPDIAEVTLVLRRKETPDGQKQDP